MLPGGKLSDLLGGNDLRAKPEFFAHGWSGDITWPMSPPIQAANVLLDTRETGLIHWHRGSLKIKGSKRAVDG